MELIYEEGDLECGVLSGGRVQTRFKLRAAVLSDSYRAAASVAIPEKIDSDQPTRVAYQMAVDDAQILCQIVALGDAPEVPSPEVLATQLDPDDMSILRAAAARVKKKRLQSRVSSKTSGEQKSRSSEPGSA